MLTPAACKTDVAVHFAGSACRTLFASSLPRGAFLFSPGALLLARSLPKRRDLRNAQPVQLCHTKRSRDCALSLLMTFTSRANATNSASTRRSIQGFSASRSEEHTSELQSRPHLVCRLLLEKKKA